MTTATHFIAVAAEADRQITIEAVGASADQAIAKAAEATGADASMFVAQPCTKALHDYVTMFGGARLSWGKNDAGLQDLLD